MLADNPDKQVFRAWVPGCSTGEEVYSLAIVFYEAVAKLKPARKVALQIFGTDLDRDSIDKARRGLYLPNIAADVSPDRLRRFFVQEETGFRLNKAIREVAIFAPQNVISDPPFTKVDILSCSNLLIYLSAELQRKIFPLFHYSLNPGGVLLLGSSESIGQFLPASSRRLITNQGCTGKRSTPEHWISAAFRASLAFPCAGCCTPRQTRSSISSRSRSMSCCGAILRQPY